MKKDYGNGHREYFLDAIKKQMCNDMYMGCDMLYIVTSYISLLMIWSLMIQLVSSVDCSVYHRQQ